jgi:DNA-binding protein HU-beta
MISTSDLIKTVAETVFAVNGVKTAEASRQSFEKGKLAVEGVLSAIQQGLTKGDSIRLVGFGSLTVKSVPERQGVNPRTGKPMTIKATKMIRFSAGKMLKEAVNGVESSIPIPAQEQKANQKKPAQTTASTPKKK